MPYRKKLLEELFRVPEVSSSDLLFEGPDVVGQRLEVVAHPPDHCGDKRDRQIVRPARLQSPAFQLARDRRGLDVCCVERYVRIHRPVNSEHPIRSNELIELDVVYVSAATRFRTVQCHEDVVSVDAHRRYRTTDGTVTDRPVVQSKAFG